MTTTTTKSTALTTIATTAKTNTPKAGKQVAKLPLVMALFPLADKAKNGEQWIQASKTLPTLLLRECAIRFLVEQELAESGEVSRERRKKQLEIQEEVDKAIGQQFRRASIRVHPDHHGEEFKSDFDALKLAYELLQDPAVRQDYLQDMLPVVEVLKPELVQLSHQNWVQQHLQAKAKAEEQAKHTRLIEGVSWNKTPPKLRVRRVDMQQRQLILELRPIQPSSRFRECYTKVILAVNGTHKVIVSRTELEKVYHPEFDLYVWAVGMMEDWNSISVSWYAQMDVEDGTIVETMRSEPLEFQLADPAYEQALHERPVVCEQARRCTGCLQQKTATFRAHEESRSDRTTVQTRQQVLHKMLGQAQSIIRKLYQILNVLDQETTTCPELSALQRAVHDAALVQSGFVDALVSLDKKDSLKAFAQSLAHMVESGEADSWLSQVSQQDLVNQGAEVNRLYQLLIEGKNASLLFLDAGTLRTAARRTNLFTEKQCQALSQRSSELEAQQQAEIDRILKEQQQQQQLQQQQQTEEICAAKSARQEVEPRDSVAVAGLDREALMSEVEPQESKGSLRNENSVPNSKSAPCEAFSEQKPPVVAVVDPSRGVTVPVVGQKAKKDSLRKENVVPDSKLSKSAPRESTSDRKPPAKASRPLSKILAAVHPPKAPPQQKATASKKPANAAAKAKARRARVSKKKSPPLETRRLPNTTVETKKIVPPKQPLQHKVGTAWNVPNVVPSTIGPIPQKHEQQSSTSPLTVATSTSSFNNSASLVVAQPEPVNEDLLQFLQTQQNCLKLPPHQFCSWLLSQDVDSLGVLQEAVLDEDFFEEMQSIGIKGFKRSAFKKGIVNAVDSKISRLGENGQSALDKFLSAAGISKQDFHEIDSTAPDDLQCSISTVLMVLDPVLAADSYTYERQELESWITTQQAKGEPVTSPRTNEILPHHSLTPNTALRNMAREYLLSKVEPTKPKAS